MNGEITSKRLLKIKGSHMMQKFAGALFSLLIVSFSVSSFSQVKVSHFQMMLLGSDFDLCRSSATHHCSGEQAATFSNNRTRSALKYKLAIAQIEKMMHVARWRPSRQALRYDLHLLFNAIAKKAGIKVLSYSQLLSAWKSMIIKRDGKLLSGHSLFLSMTESELSMILDHLEFSQIDHFGRRLKESIVVDELSEKPTVDFVKKIVNNSMRKGDKANILIATIGNRDSFSDVDAYLQLFDHFGAQTSWLPIDAALNQLVADKKHCDQLSQYRGNIMKSYDRRRIYKDLVAQQQRYCTNMALLSDKILAADALVIVGDDPRLMNQSLRANDKDSELLTLIRNQMNSNKLAVIAVGNMAKGVVRSSTSGAVILGGNSEHALQNGTSTLDQISHACKEYDACDADYNSVIYQQGGIGLLNFPIVDTQVSASGNIARLAQVAVDGKHGHSLSIDKDTALLINQQADTIKYQVIGRHGIVYLSLHPTTKTLHKINYHYFTPDDEITVNHNELTVVYPKWKAKPAEQQAQIASYNNLFYGDSFKKFTQQACVISDKQWSGLAGRNKQFTIELGITPTSEFYMGGLKINDSYQLYCSINALSLTFKRN